MASSAVAMPAPLRRKSRRLTPSRREGRSPSSATRAATAFWAADCGGGTNSSLEAIRVGIGGGASSAASSSHWRTHMVDPRGSLGQRTLPHRQHQPAGLALANAEDLDVLALGQL